MCSFKEEASAKNSKPLVAAGEGLVLCMYYKISPIEFIFLKCEQNMLKNWKKINSIDIT